jgi:hypothetical protein
LHSNSSRQPSSSAVLDKGGEPLGNLTFAERVGDGACVVESEESACVDGTD